MKSARKGFTLLEAIVALFIVGITAIAAMEAVSNELNAHARAKRALEAQSLAEHKMTMVQMLFYEELESFPDSLAHGRFEEPFQEYQWTTRVSHVYTEENLFDVALEVTWPNGAYELKTMLYRRPQVVTQPATPPPAGPGRQGGPAPDAQPQFGPAFERGRS